MSQEVGPSSTALAYNLTLLKVKLGQKSVKILVGFLGDLKTPKFHYEINWPLINIKKSGRRTNFFSLLRISELYARLYFSGVSFHYNAKYTKYLLKSHKWTWKFLWSQFYKVLFAKHFIWMIFSKTKQNLGVFFCNLYLCTYDKNANGTRV